MHPQAGLEGAVRPDYDGAWIGAVVPALRAADPPDWLPAVSRGARGVVLLVLDGLGWNLLRGHASQLPRLQALQGGPITSAAPTTTVAGLTSIVTGRTPAEHGLVGFRIRVGGDLLNVLQWRPMRRNGTAPDPASVQPHPCLLGDGVPLVTRAEFGGTGFTEAHLRGGRLVGWRTEAVLVEHVRRLVTADREPFVYAYYDGIDKVAHEFGLNDGYVDAELVATDRLVGALLDILPDDVALVVTADHGMVHVPPEQVRGLEDLAPLIAAYAGEGRLRTLFSRTGSSQELLAAATERHADVAWVLSREQLFDEGWLGEGAGAAVRSRIGDVVLAAREPVSFLAPDMPYEGMLIGCHGSLTADEVLVPLLAGRGTA